MITNNRYFAKGKRSIVYKTSYNSKEVIIKKAKKKANVRNIKNEIKFLKIVNKYKIGPKFITSKKDYLIYEYVPGLRILDFMKKAKKKQIKKVIINILNQCYVLDKIKINKYEMHHPIKHILIDKKPVMIDFERCRKVENPKNVTQFCQFLMNLKLMYRDLNSLREYKKDKNVKNYKKLIKLISV